MKVGKSQKTQGKGEKEKRENERTKKKKKKIWKSGRRLRIGTAI